MLCVWQTADDDVRSRIAAISADRIEQLLNGQLSQNTQRVIENSVAIFSAYADARNTSLQTLQQQPASEVNKFLQRFYTDVRKRDGSPYTHSGLVSIRYGLQKHFRKMCRYDVVNDRAFRSSGEAFSAVLDEMKRQGREVQHKSPVSSDDFRKLYGSGLLSTVDPVGLQNKVFVDLMVHLCKRGRDNLRAMKKSDFLVRTDTTGRYVAMGDRLCRNNRRDAAGKRGRERRMYHQPGNPRCPVASFEKYTAKLNRAFDAFWQKPTTKLVDERDACWYEYFPIGKNTLATKMKTLSVESGLSAVYTNHCLQSTCPDLFATASDRTSESDLCGTDPDYSGRRDPDNVSLIAVWPTTST